MRENLSSIFRHLNSFDFDIDLLFEQRSILGTYLLYRNVLCVPKYSSCVNFIGRAFYSHTLKATQNYAMM